MQNQNQKNQRQLKVYPKYRRNYRKDVIVPEIRLCGQWLKQAGFNSGKTVSVQIENNRLVITQV